MSAYDDWELYNPITDAIQPLGERFEPHKHPQIVEVVRVVKPPNDKTEGLIEVRDTNGVHHTYAPYRVGLQLVKRLNV